MRIGKIVSSVEYLMDEQFQNLAIFLAKFWFSKLEFLKISLLFSNLEKSKNYPNLIIFKIIKFSLLMNS